MTSSAPHLSRRAVPALWLLLWVALACAPFSPTSSPVPSATPPGESPTAPAVADQPGDVIAQAMQALADALDVDAATIALVTLERQEFRDGALGCAEPGEVAAAVVTPGYRVLLRGGDTLYELHTNLNGTVVRCLPTGTPVVHLPDFTPAGTTTPQPTGATPDATPDRESDPPGVAAVGSALRAKDYERLRETMTPSFWLGFYGAGADQLAPAEAVQKMQETYLASGLVRIYPDVSVEKLLPDWTRDAPYARFVFSTGWGEGQKDDGILLFSEQADTLQWAGLFYVFDALKSSAYGDQVSELPPPPSAALDPIVQAIEAKSYDQITAVLTTPILFGFYQSEASQLSPDAFVAALRQDYLEPGQVKVRPEVDVRRLLPDWEVEPPCDDLLYSTGWGEEAADDGILCLRNEPQGPRWAGLLYVFADIREIAYAEPPPEEGEAPELEGMIHIPAGAFLMGSSGGDVGAVQADCLRMDSGCNAGQFEDETPQRQVTLSAYYIDRTEVTLAQFKEFVAATGYKTTSEAKGDAIQYTWRVFDTPERQDHPVRWMSWQDANAYCQWAGKRLPTEAEWEKAARGADGWIYPWGNVWDDARVPHGDTAAVTAYPNGASPYGVLGMAGGVWEWVMDWYDPFYYQNGPSVDPSGPGQTRDKVLRGGAFDNAIWKLRTAHRHYGGAEGYAHDHGFRCARTP